MAVSDDGLIPRNSRSRRKAKRPYTNITVSPQVADMVKVFADSNDELNAKVIALKEALESKGIL